MEVVFIWSSGASLVLGSDTQDFYDLVKQYGLPEKMECRTK